MIVLYNTLSKSVEKFTPISPPNVGLYTCGITAYDYCHIGHGRKYVGDDVLRRTLSYFGYKVNHVQNVTDVGHLVSDGDSGEDKLEKGAIKAGKTVWEVAEFFTQDFYNSMDTLNILRPTIICKATDHILAQIELIQTLITKGHAYDTPEAVYFDVTSFPEYGKLFGQNIEDKKTAVRQEVETGLHKKNAQDFSLWFKRVGRYENHAMHWDSPWGDGFPGWHIECSAMSMKYLGNSFDIHTGGMDHIPVHHPNEIAQSEGATGVKFVNFWVHHSFLTVDSQKMSKSLGNVYRIADVVEKGFSPLSLRYLFLSAHYRKPLNFTWEALENAQNSLTSLKKFLHNFYKEGQTHERDQLSQEKLAKVTELRAVFEQAIGNDLNMPQALAAAWEAAKSNIPPQDKYDLILEFDQVLGLKLAEVELEQNAAVPEEIKLLLQKRDELRVQKKFAEADLVRQEIKQKGYNVVDQTSGSSLEKLID